jgi:hypothetical protein
MFVEMNELVPFALFSCEYYHNKNMRLLMGHRAWQPAGRNNGWFLGCYSSDHNHHDPEELAMMHLMHLVEQFPGLFPYVAMPVDTQVVFEERQVIIFRPGEQGGEVDLL